MVRRFAALVLVSCLVTASNAQRRMVWTRETIKDNYNITISTEVGNMERPVLIAAIDVLKENGIPSTLMYIYDDGWILITKGLQNHRRAISILSRRSDLRRRGLVLKPVHFDAKGICSLEPEPNLPPDSGPKVRYPD